MLDSALPPEFGGCMSPMGHLLLPPQMALFISQSRCLSSILKLGFIMGTLVDAYAGRLGDMAISRVSSGSNGSLDTCAHIVFLPCLRGQSGYY